jgi:hypothetical protein
MNFIKSFFGKQIVRTLIVISGLVGVVTQTQAANATLKVTGIQIGHYGGKITTQFRTDSTFNGGCSHNNWFVFESSAPESTKVEAAKQLRMAFLTGKKVGVVWGGSGCQIYATDTGSTMMTVDRVNVLND